MARVTEYFTIGVFGVEKNAFERYKNLMSLFEVAEEKLMEMVVSIR